ncbi:cuticle protein 7-like [Ischnura elegans]|uniref:cuticle protein 7-like n=1 Tax=Ischnura elegans TaxID=197161 RepID=UPI001ED89303|nr:cuticle protein 7-like [Ischnura elegans]
MAAFQQILFAAACLIGISYAGEHAHHYGGNGGEHSGGHVIDYYAHPKYNFDYTVHDLHTGDVKNQWETRDGDVVKGSYSVNEPDGTIRKVEYTADKHNGFNAVVKRLGKSYHPEPVKHHYDHGAAQNAYAGQNNGDDSAAGVGSYGNGHHFGASSYSNANIHRLGVQGGHH